MKEAIGNTFIMNFIIIFTIVFIALFIGALTYTKALRIKNRLTDIIEENEKVDDETLEQINSYLNARIH